MSIEDLIVEYERLAASAHQLEALGLTVAANLVRAAQGLIAEEAIPAADTRCVVCFSDETWHDDHLGIDFCAGCHGAPPDPIAAARAYLIAIEDRR
jgi:hypothetical protein